MQSNFKSYYPGLDFLKAFGLLLMVCGHYSLMNTEVTTIIYSFHMPLFFIISGFISSDKDLKNTIIRDIKRIMVPYFVFNALLLVFTIMLEFKSGHLSLKVLWSHIAAILVGIGYKTDKYNPVCTTMWFFYVLFLVKAFSVLIGNKFRIRIFVSLVAITIVALFEKNEINTDFPIDSFLLAFPLYVWGGLFKKIVERLNCGKRKRYFLLLLVLPAIFLLSYKNGRADMDVFKFGNSLFMFYFISITICSILILNVLAMGGGNFAEICHQISKGAPVIVSLNLWLILLLKKILLYIFPCIIWNNIVGLAVAFLVIAICHPITCLCNKYLPFALGFRK